MPFINLPGDKAHKTRRAGRHDKYYQQQDDPVNRAGQPGRDALGDIRDVVRGDVTQFDDFLSALRR